MITITGWIIKRTESGKAIVFLWDERSNLQDTLLLPISQIQIVEDEINGDKVTIPKWLAKKLGVLK